MIGQSVPRRGRVRFAAWLASAALAVPLTVPLHAPLLASPSENRFQPPASPMLLTRVLYSPLADGGQIVARRTFEIRILPAGSGYRVEGRQVDCAVEAPPSLEPLAELERKRVESGLFPMVLDGTGLILPPESRPASSAMAKATPVALAMLRSGGMTSGEEARAAAFVQRLAVQPASSNWPADLFRPAPGRRLDDRAIVTADGLSGHVQVEITASTHQDSGLLDRLERIVTTELGGTRRTTREEWLLTVTG